MNWEEFLGDATKKTAETAPNNQVVRCIGNFDSHSFEMKNILKRHWPILLADMDL